MSTNAKRWNIQLSEVLRLLAEYKHIEVEDISVDINMDKDTINFTFLGVTVEATPDLIEEFGADDAAHAILAGFNIKKGFSN